MALEFDPKNLAKPAEILLKNDNAEPVAFRMRTNATKRYFCKPARGIIKPGSEQLVNVKIKDTSLTVAELAVKDAILVDRVSLTPEEADADPADLWEHMDASRISHQRFHCQFDSKSRSGSTDSDQSSTGSLAPVSKPVPNSSASSQPTATTTMSKPSSASSTASSTILKKGQRSQGHEASASDRMRVAEATALGLDIARLTKEIHNLKTKRPLAEPASVSVLPPPPKSLSRSVVFFLSFLSLILGLVLPFAFDMAYV